eukprot:704957-Hanusia_phi.AAC.1
MVTHNQSFIRLPGSPRVKLPTQFLSGGGPVRSMNPDRRTPGLPESGDRRVRRDSLSVLRSAVYVTDRFYFAKTVSGRFGVRYGRGLNMAGRATSAVLLCALI